MSKLSVSLSQESAPSQWGKNALVSFTESSAVIHIDNNDSLVKIQKAARKLDGFCSQAQLVGEWNIEQQWAFALGFDTPAKNNSVEWCENQNKDELSKRFAVYQFARNLVNGSPEDIFPESLSQKVEDWLKDIAGDHITCKRWTGEELKEAGWVGVYNVGRGSDRPPVLLEIDFNPTGNPDAPVSAALVGKGITYDSGGYSLKPSDSMSYMKCDMAGAATVSGALGLAIYQGLQQRVKLFLCCAENLVSGHAFKLGDILTYKNGVTVEILNTDAEGRLVLADGLLAAGESGAKMIIDAATLTGAAIVALGYDYNAVFTMDDELREKTVRLANSVNEPAWALPLAPFHQEKCPSPYADTGNSRAEKGGGSGGASNAAGFLSRFVPNNGQGWVHLDLAGAFLNSPTSTRSAGGTASGFRTIAELLLKQ
ncbi:aminopeptidase PepB [Paraneptunicella aestuarii]|uniref:aminopeptidase PepB n=1 Tax=Paraneptunicella aestuarii TaxID=2831148 RepID=UPI001E4D3A7A|nr:aminopeptidase PepB [Paraneptunicella aestuarii]UAA38524.1 aminopeptidase PepB [Paraneptunicella aestuarii]